MQAQAMHAYCPRCPHCQRAMRFAAYRAGDYSLTKGLPRVRASQLGQVYRSALAVAAPQVQKPQWERRTPTIPINLERAFVVPVAVALGSGAFTFMWSAMALRTLFDQPASIAIDGGLFTASIAATASWVGMLAHAVNASSTVEQAWGDAQPSTQYTPEELEAEEDPDSTRLHRYEIVRRNGGYSNIKYPQLPVAPDKLRKIAKGVLAGRPFSEREWESVINSKQFRQLRNELVDAGLMAWKVDGAPQQGVTLTEDGREFFVSIVEEGARQWAG